MRTAVGAAIAGLLLPGSATAQMGGACYDVQVGEWALADPAHADVAPPPPDPSAGSVNSELPRRLRFLDEPDGRGNFRLEVPEDALDVPHPWRSWHGGTDSLTLVFSTGFGGTSTGLARDGETWTGWSRTHSDALPHYPYHRPVTLERVPCSAPPPQPASLDPALPRTVAFRGLPDVALAREPDAEWQAILEAGEWVHGLEPEGPLAGADSVRVRLTGSGRVEQIDLVYSTDFDAAEFMTAMDRITAPHVTMSRWRNRTTRVMVRRFGFGTVITLVDPRLRFE